VNKQKIKNKRRLRRRQHTRNKLRGDAQRPRLCIERSLKHISVQLIDDDSGKTLASASTRDKDLKGSLKYGGNADAAAEVGKAIAKKASDAGISAARFDRGHNKYHGRVAALADAAREAGLQI